MTPAKYRRVDYGHPVFFPNTPRSFRGSTDLMPLTFFACGLTAVATDAVPVLEEDPVASPVRVVVRTGDAVFTSPEEGLWSVAAGWDGE